MKTVFKIIKLIGALMISIGVGALVKNILMMVTPPGAKAVIRICMLVAGYFVGGLAATAASTHFETQVDRLETGTEKIKDVIESDVNLKVEIET